MIFWSKNRFDTYDGPDGIDVEWYDPYFMDENNDFLELAANDPCAGQTRAKVYTARRTSDTRNNNNAKSHSARERNSRCR